MISSKKELKEFIKEDFRANGFSKRSKRSNAICKYLICMRYLEYIPYRGLGRYYRKIVKHFFYKYSLQTGIQIPWNTFGKGVCIPHFGSIIVNSSARFGDNCHIMGGG